MMNSTKITALQSYQEVSLDFAFDSLCEILFPDYLPRTLKAEQLLWDYLNQSYGIHKEANNPDMTVFVNAQSNVFGKGDINNICGDIQWSPIEVRVRRRKSGDKIVKTENPPSGHKTVKSPYDLLFDSGVFGEMRLNDRMTYEHSLDRQLKQLSQLATPPPRGLDRFLRSLD